MNINKKLDRVKQWAGEKMGGEVKTNVSDEFKSLEMEMELRHEGILLRKIRSANMANIDRYEQNAQIHDCIRQVPIEAERGRRQRENATRWIHGADHDKSWRRLRAGL